jgi:hypothetical protein
MIEKSKLWEEVLDTYEISELKEKVQERLNKDGDLEAYICHSERYDRTQRQTSKLDDSADALPKCFNRVISCQSSELDINTVSQASTFVQGGSNIASFKDFLGPRSVYSAAICYVKLYDWGSFKV